MERPRLRRLPGPRLGGTERPRLRGLAARRPRRRRRTRLLVAAGLLPVLALVAPLPYLYAATAGRRHADPADAGTAPVALVFGAGIRSDGTLTPLLRDRVALAVTLWTSGRVGALLMTGDHSRTDHDEVDAMKAYAVAHGVPNAKVALDHAGFTTYDSCYRAHAVFGVDRAIVVTTRFHVPRAVYTCRTLGVRATGVGAADFGRYTGDAVGWTVRETFAAGKALWQLHVTRPRPHFLGPREPFPGTAAP
jgi:vancomycin permeability regulator SanA